MVNMPANKAMISLYNHFVHKKNNTIKTEEYEKESQIKTSDINHNVSDTTNYCIGNCSGCTIADKDCPLSHP
jgi:hypothetical protein